MTETTADRIARIERELAEVKQQIEADDCDYKPIPPKETYKCKVKIRNVSEGQPQQYDSADYQRWPTSMCINSAGQFVGFAKYDTENAPSYFEDTTTANRPEPGGERDMWDAVRDRQKNNGHEIASHQFDEHYSLFSCSMRPTTRERYPYKLECQRTQRWQPEKSRLDELRAAKELWYWDESRKDILYMERGSLTHGAFSCRDWENGGLLSIKYPHPVHCFPTRQSAYEYAAKRWAESGVTVYWVMSHSKSYEIFNGNVYPVNNKDCYYSLGGKFVNWYFKLGDTTVLVTPSLARALAAVRERLAKC